MDQQYQYNNPRTVTYIDELPDIDAIGGMKHNGMGPNTGNDQYASSNSMYDKPYDRSILPPGHQQLKSKLRHPHMALPESGMSMMNPVYPVNQNVVNVPQQMHQQMPQQMHQQMHQQMPQQMHQQMPSEQEHADYFEHMSNSSKLSCLEISEHIKDCHICSKFYNNDNTVYIIVIVILSIICILLLKRVLDI